MGRKDATQCGLGPAYLGGYVGMSSPLEKTLQLRCSRALMDTGLPNRPEKVFATNKPRC